MTARLLVVDFGGTATKALVCEGDRIARQLCFGSELYPCSAEGLLALADAIGVDLASLTRLVTTGGTSAALPERVGGAVQVCVNELKALGTGGLECIQADAALVVSIGTGTPMTVARRVDGEVEVKHVGGLGLGGGTIKGLGRLLCQVDTFEELDALAVKGRTEHVDLLVGDIVGSGIGVVPAELTASNFGKAGSAGVTHSQADIAAGLFTMVGQSVARLAIMLARHAEVEPIVVVGQVIENAYMREVFVNIGKLFGGQFAFAPEARYAAARGAFSIARSTK